MSNSGNCPFTQPTPLAKILKCLPCAMHCARPWEPNDETVVIEKNSLNNTLLQSQISQAD